jgi:metal-responsive CopG/Arc/MetJ family transcriptional regulator
MTLPGGLVARLDDVAPSSPYRTRSALVAHLLSSALESTAAAGGKPYSEDHA